LLVIPEGSARREFLQLFYRLFTSRQVKATSAGRQASVSNH
jgi:hypothetical protein